MSNTQVKTRDAYGVTYADPLKPDYTVRFKTTSSAKSLNGVSVTNYVTEIIANDSVPVTLGDNTANDAIAVRVRLSGSNLSMVRRKAILTAIASQLDVWATENVLLGFAPVTAPVAP